MSLLKFQHEKYRPTNSRGLRNSKANDPLIPTQNYTAVWDTRFLMGIHNSLQLLPLFRKNTCQHTAQRSTSALGRRAARPS